MAASDDAFRNKLAVASAAATSASDASANIGLDRMDAAPVVPNNQWSIPQLRIAQGVERCPRSWCCSTSMMICSHNRRPTASGFLIHRGSSFALYQSLPLPAVVNREKPHLLCHFLHGSHLEQSPCAN